MKIIFGLIVLSLFIGISESCGVTTHNVIANRALYWYLADQFPQYKEIIENNLGAFQNGAAFPDWGYNCILTPILGQLRNGSEVTHWPPFQNVTVQHIRSKYSKPWNQSAQELIAFLLGIVAHSTADVIWHDMRLVDQTRQGFIQALANSDYNARTIIQFQCS